MENVDTGYFSWKGLFGTFMLKAISHLIGISCMRRHSLLLKDNTLLTSQVTVTLQLAVTI